jgi:hypothetical protein
MSPRQHAARRRRQRGALLALVLRERRGGFDRRARAAQ